MGYGMTADEMQKKMDARYPSGVHVWAKFGDGSDPVTFLVPRVFVLTKDRILITPMNETVYFDNVCDYVDFPDSSTTVIRMGKSEFRLTPATTRATEILSDRISEAFESETLSRFRNMWEDEE